MVKRLWLTIPLPYRDILVRAAKTFAQTFVGTLVVAVVAAPSLDRATLASLVLSAASGAASLVWNTVFRPSLVAVIIPVPMPAGPVVSDELLPGHPDLN